MRTLLFTLAISLFYIQSAQATTIQLKSIFKSKASGQVTITEDKSTKVDYVFNVEQKDQAYAILMYKDGNCQDFSTPIPVMVSDAKDKKSAFNPKGTQFLIYQAPSKQTKLSGSQTAPEGDYFSFEPKGKILVLVAVKNENSDTGLALACGVYP